MANKHLIIDTRLYSYDTYVQHNTDKVTYLTLTHMVVVLELVPELPEDIRLSFSITRVQTFRCIMRQSHRIKNFRLPPN